MTQNRSEKNMHRVVLNNKNDNKRQMRIYSCLMNCAAPLLTVMFLAGSVCWAAEVQYDDKNVFDSNPEAGAVLTSGGIISNPEKYVETKLPVNSAVANVTENTGAELVEACGVYIDNEFVGAVVSGEHIENKLELVLEDYRNEDDIIEADYAVETDLKQGVYRSAALVSANDMTEYLTGEKEVITEYTVSEDDTPEKLADDFGMTVEEVKELNPEIDELEKGKPVKVKETVAVLPVKYTCEVTEEEELEYDVILEESGAYFSGEEAVIETGEKGKKVSNYEVTYIDGAEVSRKLKNSETVLEPVDEIIAVGTAEKELYSESIPESEEIDYTEEVIEKTSEDTPEEVSESTPEEAEPVVTNSFVWPVNGGYVSDPFKSNRNHKGLDIAASYGTEIYASSGGIVTNAGWNDGGYGYYVKIDHGNGYVTLYAHASEVYVSSGQIVSAGDVIAAVGSTGDSTGNHCHFEVRYNGDYLNPQDFIG